MTEHVLYNADSRHLGDFVEKSSVDLIVTSPPYFLEKSYEEGMTWNEHLSLVDDVVCECEKVLKQNRIICWNISHSPQGNVPIYHALALEKHFTFVDDIIWRKQSGNSRRFGNFVQYGQYYPNTNWEHILIYAKGKPIVKVDNSDMKWALQYRDDIWDINPQGNDNHPAPFPEELVENCLRFYSNVGETVLDCFGGSGTTMKVARDFGRNSISIERDPVYCEVIKKRVGFSQKSLFNDITYEYHERD